MRMRLSFVVLSVALLAFAPAPFAKKERQREDLTDVVGTWEIVQWWENGKMMPEVERTLQVEMKKDRFAIFEKADRDAIASFSMTLHPTAQPPGFTWHHKEGRVVIVGSYRLQKGQMTMIYCTGARLAARPRNFAEAECRLLLRRIRRD